MKRNVAVFFGGRSTEHEISCISANQAMKALDTDKYDITPIYISKDNDLYTGEALFDLANYGSLSDLCAKCEKVMLYKDGNHVFVRPVKSSLFRKSEKSIDVAFPVVHGTNVEDGSLAGYLEMLGLPYTCSDVLGGAIGQDKAIMKAVLKEEEVPMVPYFAVYEDDSGKEPDRYLEKAKNIGFPLIAKPANLGSSIGIEVIHNEEEFPEKMKECFRYDFKVVVERMIEELKEVNISVMGSEEDFSLSEIEEVMKGDELLSFRDKYEGGSKGKLPSKGVKSAGSKGMASTDRKVPADLSDEQRRKIEETAAKSFKALHAHGVVRIDFMIDKKDGSVYVNEINSIPGSLAFYLWEAKGINFSEECDILIKNALKRYAAREKKTYSFETNILANYGRK